MQTVYDKAGQVLMTRDTRGTLTAFDYDQAGRRIETTQAAGHSLAVTHHSAYDKAGRQLRHIRNYEPVEIDGVLLHPDTWNAQGDWLFQPHHNGEQQDINVITEYIYDQASRRIQTIQPNGAVTQTAYFKNGQVAAHIDAADSVTLYRYDALYRRILVVQSYLEQADGSASLVDPANWLWNNGQYQLPDGTPVAHGADNDRNVIVQVLFDVTGNRLSLRDPNGNQTTYQYDDLGRRIQHTNPQNITWQTTYSEVNQAQQMTQTYPGINGGSSYPVTHTHDRAGRKTSINYHTPASTADVRFSHDRAGNRLAMIENDGTSDIRQTDYAYDAANRLTEVALINADGTGGGTVQHHYNLSSQRTGLTIDPAGDNLSLAYGYDVKGRLVQLIDYEGDIMQFSYDALGRHIATQYAGAVVSSYCYDRAGHLQSLRHRSDTDTLLEIHYEVDSRGNRTRALEWLRQPGAILQTRLISPDDETLVYDSTAWTLNPGNLETTTRGAMLEMQFLGNETIQLTMGEGPDHGMYDVYINGTFWQSFDGYAAASGQRVIDVHIQNDSYNTLTLRNGYEASPSSTLDTCRVQFVQLSVDSALVVQDIHYTYDTLSRLLEADYNTGATLYTYGYDPAGNLVNHNGTTRIYNELNQMTGDGLNSYQYDANGNIRLINN